MAKGPVVTNSPLRGWIGKHNVANKLYKQSLLNACCLVAGLSIFSFGYDQGLMGGVNTSRSYVELMGIGEWDEASGMVVITNPGLQGLINGCFYLPGTLVGCLLGGWFGDKFGRVATIGWMCVWACATAAIMASAQSSDMMIVARVLNGMGTGILNAVTPVWATETASYQSRGAFVPSQFTLNIAGVVVAYWLQFGTSKMPDPYSSFIWRFPIAFQIVPLMILFAVIWFMPESPRWLVSQGREDEARFILQRLRGSEGEEGELAESELQDIINMRNMESETAHKSSYFHMFFGIGQGKLHTARRVQLVIWLQIFQEWVGIAGITIYGPTIFSIAGIGPDDRLWVSGLNNITYMFSTLICVFTLDRIGRRWTLWWGAAGQGIAMFAAGGLARATMNASESNKDAVGGAATFFVFLYTAIFGATWLTVPWLYQAEIFPLTIRAKGNAFGVAGWSIGNGWCVFLLPTIFDRIHEKALYIFGAANIIAIVITWALYPESNQRTLEEMDLVFASDSIWNWEAEKNFARLKEENPQLVQAAKAGDLVDPETGLISSRRASRATVDQGKPTLEKKEISD